MIQQPERLGRRRSTGPWLVAWPVGLVVIVALGLAGGRWTLPDGLDAPTSRSPVSPVVSAQPEVTARGGRVTAIAIAPGPMSLIAGHGRIWVASRSDATVRGIDPATALVEVTVRIPPADADRPLAAGYPMVTSDDRPPILAVAAGSLWATGLPRRSDIVRLDPGTGRVTARVRIDSGATGLVGDHRGLWVTTDAGTLVRIDPATNEVAATVVPGGRPVHAALGATALWVSAGSRVLRLDPADGRTTASVPGGGGPIGPLGDTIWARSLGSVSPALVAIDEATGRVVERADIATSGRGGLALSLPALEPVDLAGEATSFAPREPQIVVVGETTWVARSDLAEVWRMEGR